MSFFTILIVTYFYLDKIVCREFKQFNCHIEVWLNLYRYNRFKQKRIMQNPKQAIRPTIITEREAQGKAEKFQNNVLRPILKMQNELLLAIYKHYLRKRRVKYEGMSKEQRLAWIAQSLQKDNRLRGILLGTVIGHFTIEEWEGYQTDESELKRRIINLMTQRLQSQAGELL